MPGTITTDLTLVNATGGDAEVITNWTTTAAWSGAPAVSNDVYLQGSNAINARASTATPGTIALYWDHLTTGTANLDLTTSGYHVYFWIKCFSLPSMEKKVRGGIGVSISSTAGVTKTGTDPWSGINDSKQWFVTGSDFEPLSGWVCYVVDPASTADLSLGTPVMTSVDRIGIRAGALQTVGGGSVKPLPVIWDALRYGTGLTIKDGTGSAPVAFTDVYTTDSTTANQYGIISKQAGTYFGAGKFNFGTTSQTAETIFYDFGQVFVWQDFPVASGFYEFIINGASGQETTLHLGQYTGGLTSKGCTIKGTGHESQRLIAPAIVSGGTGYTANDILTVSGGTGSTAAQFKVITVSSGVITEIRMETAGSYSSPPTGTLSVTGGTGSGATFTATVAGGSIWTLTASAANQVAKFYACTFSEMKSAALAYNTVSPVLSSNCGTTNNSPTLTTTGSFNTSGVVIGMSVSGTNIQANTVVSSIESATSLTMSKNATGTGSSLTMTFSHSSEVRGSTFSNSGAVTSNGCVIDNCTFQDVKTTAPISATYALIINSSTEMGRVTNCSFINCNRAIKITAAGTYTFDNLTFSGNSYDVENSSAGAVTINATNGANPGTFINTGGGSTTINNSKTLTVTVKDSAGSAIQNAQTSIYKSSDNSELLNADTNASGIASTTYNYLADTDIYVRVRKSSTGATKYIPASTTGTITSSGFSVTITLSVDTNA